MSFIGIVILFGAVFLSIPTLNKASRMSRMCRRAEGNEELAQKTEAILEELERHGRHFFAPIQGDQDSSQSSIRRDLAMNELMFEIDVQNDRSGTNTFVHRHRHVLSGAIGALGTLFLDVVEVGRLIYEAPPLRCHSHIREQLLTGFNRLQERVENVSQEGYATVLPSVYLEKTSGINALDHYTDASQEHLEASTLHELKSACERHSPKDILYETLTLFNRGEPLQKLVAQAVLVDGGERSLVEFTAGMGIIWGDMAQLTRQIALCNLVLHRNRTKTVVDNENRLLAQKFRQIDGYLKVTMTDCNDWYRIAGARRDGMYQVKPAGRTEPIDVMCDMEEDGGTEIEQKGLNSKPKLNGEEDRILKASDFMCYLCTSIVRIAEEIAKSGIEAVRDQLDEYCDDLIFLRADCKKIVNSLLNSTFNMIKEHADPTKICIAVSLCDSSVQNRSLPLSGSDIQVIGQSFFNCTKAVQEPTLMEEDGGTEIEQKTCCPVGWRQLSGDSRNRCIKVFDGASDFTDSESECVNEHSGHLASVYSQSDNDIILHEADQLLSFDSHIRVWIGGRRLADGDWSWIIPSEKPFNTYTNWSPGEPNNPTTENCLQMYDGNGNWNNLECDNALGFVCEKETSAKYCSHVEEYIV